MALTTAQIQQAYVTFFSRPADAAGLAYWAQYTGSIDNLYATFAQQAEYTAAFASLSNGQKVNLVYQNLFGRDADVAGLAYWTLALDNGGVTVANLALALANGAQGADVETIENRVTAATAFTAALDTAAEVLAYSGAAANALAKAWLAGVTTDATLTAAIEPTALATNVAAVVAGGGVAGQTFTLTTSADTVTGTSGNDTINGNTADTWTGFDAIDGGAGTDTMNVLVSATSVPGAATIKNVESLNINATGVGYTIDTTAYTGLTSVKVSGSQAGAISVTGATTTAASVVGTGASTVDVVGTGGALSITTGAGAVKVGQTAVVNAITSATIVGGSTVQISDNKTTTQADGTTLTSVSLRGNTGLATLDTDGLTTLSLTNVVKDAADVVINAAAGTRTLTINLNGVDEDTGAGDVRVKDAEATTTVVNATGAASNDINLWTDNATSVTVNADEALQFDTFDVSLAATVALTGDSKITIDGVDLLSTVVFTSTSTGGVTISDALTANQQFVGTASSGKDSISIATGFAKAHSTGAGDDTVTYGGPAAAGGSIDGGDGTDTLSMTAAIAATATATTTAEGTVSNFERLSLGAYADAAGVTVALANLDDINYVTSAGATASTGGARAQAISGFTTGGTFAQTALLGTDQNVTLSGSGFTAGAADTFNFVFSATNGFVNAGTVTLADVETVSITTDDTDTTAATTAFDGNLVIAATKTITVAGDAGFNFTGSTLTALTSLDASGITATGAGGALTVATAATTGVTVTGGAGDDSITGSSASGKIDTLTGGAGNDTITGGSGNDVISGGAGNDIITTGNGNNTVTGGDGNDSITLGSGANTVDVGAGTNTVVFGTAMAGLNTITLGSGVDTLDFNVVSTAAGFYPSVIGIAAGDKIDLAGAGVTADEATLGAKITLGGAASFANYLDAATATGGATAGQEVNWFQFNGNTYVTLDNSVGATFTDGADLVIELVGLVDLTNSTLLSEVITIV